MFWLTGNWDICIQNESAESLASTHISKATVHNPPMTQTTAHYHLEL